MKRALKFWGTRGSCPVSGKEYAHFGGNTPSLEIRYDDTLIIIDAGTGIRPLGRTLKTEQNLDLFLSHFHWDHIIGFPFFKPVYRKGVEITIWAPCEERKNSRDLFNQLLSPEFFPIHLDEIQAKLIFKTIVPNQPIQRGNLKIDFHPTHHPSPTLCFKIQTPKQTIGYVTDNELDAGAEESFIAFHRNSDIFIHEAQYSSEEYEKRKGWGHSSLPKVIELIEKVQPKKWLVTHHDPTHTDTDLRSLEKLARASHLPCPVEWIGDGHVVELD